jgi:hypothetical protein
VNATSANYIIAIALLLAMPFFVVRRALRPHRTQENHHARLSARRRHVSADLSRDAAVGRLERRDRDLERIPSRREP